MILQDFQVLIRIFFYFREFYYDIFLGCIFREFMILWDFIDKFYYLENSEFLIF